MSLPINYNMTNLTNVENVLDIAKFTNEITGDLFWAAMMTGIFFIILIVTSSRATDNKFLTGLMISGFVSFILSSLLVGAGLIPFIYPLGFLIITALALLFSYTTGR